MNKIKEEEKLLENGQATPESSLKAALQGNPQQLKIVTSQSILSLFSPTIEKI